MSRQLDLTRLSGRVVLATAIGASLALCALVGSIGADAQWLVALGHIIVKRRAIPDGLPFAAASTAHWPNPLVLAELVFDALNAALGVRGLMLAQLAAVAGGLAVLARGARAEGADPIGTGAALLLLTLGAVSSLAIARVQMFSLLLFPLLLLLLRADARMPSRRLWLVVPLLALWSNLHGAAIVGLGVTLAYLALARARRAPARAALLALASAASLCLNPAGLRTIDYYHGVLSGAAAQRGAGEWGSLSLSSPFDVLLVLAGVILLWHVIRARPPLWESVTLTALALLTIHADRDGVWLLMLAVAPAARRLAPARSLRALTPPAAAIAAIGLLFAIVRGPVAAPASPSMVQRAIGLAHGSPVLAGGAIPEQVAVAGGRIWAGDPIDAFSRRVQETYLDWLAGDRDGSAAVTRRIRVVLVTRGSATATLMARMPGFRVARRSADIVLYERVGPAVAP